MGNCGQYESFHRPKSCPKLIFAPKSNNRWWSKLPLIYARSETAAIRRTFKPLWQHGRAICFADGWYEWKRKAYVMSHHLKSEGRKVQCRQYSKLLTSECLASYQFSVNGWPAMRELPVNQDNQIAAARESGNQNTKRH